MHSSSVVFTRKNFQKSDILYRIELTDTFPGSQFTLQDLIPTSTGIDNTPDQSNSVVMANLGNLAVMLTSLYNAIGPFRIDSAYRSDAVNQAVGGAPGSYHNLGIAADIIPTDTDISSWFSALMNSSFAAGLGEIYIKPTQGAIHLSLSTPEKTEWWGILDPGTGQYRRLTADEEQYYQNYAGNPGAEAPASLHLPGTVTRFANSVGSLITGIEGETTNPAPMGFAILGFVVLSAALAVGLLVKKKKPVVLA